MKILILVLSLIFYAGCANDKAMIRGAQQIIKRASGGQNESENLEEASYLLDKPLAHYYCLVDRYSKRLQEYLEKGENGDLSSALIGLGICFQKTKDDFQRRWREIYANPDGNASFKAEELLHQVKRHTIDIEETLKILERTMPDKEKIWI